MSKPQVTLTFAGDESKLTDAMNRVGDASRKMGEDVGRSSSNIVDSNGKLDSAIDRADTIDTRAMGFRDTVTGVSDSLKAWNDESLTTEERLLTMGMGIGDLASGFANYLLPVLGTVATFMKTQLLAAFTLISAHPIMFTILAIAAAVIFLVSQTEWFRKVASDVFNWVGNLAKNVFGAAVDWVVNAWRGVVRFFEDLPRNIGNALGSVGQWIGNAFKAGLNVAIDIVNWFVRRANDLIYGINVISPFGDIPYIPQIARMHNGGIVGGAPGTEQLRVLQAGEEVTSARNVGSGGAVRVAFVGDTDGAFASAFQNLVKIGAIQIEAT